MTRCRRRRCAILCGNPVASLRELVFGYALGEHLNAVSLLVVVRNIISALLIDRAGVEEMLMEMVNEFQYIPLHRPGDSDVVNQAKVNDILAETDTTCVWADGHTKLGCHEQDTEDLAHAGKTAGVDLADIDSLSLEELLEDNSVVCMLASSNTDTMGLEPLANSCVTEGIVRCSWLFNEPIGEIEANRLDHEL
jgi:hypothetical protein